MNTRSRDSSRGAWLVRAAMPLAYAILCGPAMAQDESHADAGGGTSKDDSSFLFVPYPITEPAIGAGIVAGPVWMRAGPPEPAGPSTPQAFGVGALWTDGGSRGFVAFDHRAWDDGRWRTTAIVGDVDLKLVFDGLAPGGDLDRGFSLRFRGGSISAEKRIGAGPSTVGMRLFGASAQLEFDGGTPGELLGERSKARANGLAVSWSRDTRDDVYSPTSGYIVDTTGTFHMRDLGASFDAQGLRLKWTRYQPLDRGVVGTRVVAQTIHGDPPMYLRPYVGFRGVTALRYAGEHVLSLEAEYRHPLGSRWQALAFAGAGVAKADTRGVRGTKEVSAAGVGLRISVPKYYGLVFGVDVAQGPDGTVTYIQIGNAW